MTTDAIFKGQRFAILAIFFCWEGIISHKEGDGKWGNIEIKREEEKKKWCTIWKRIIKCYWITCWALTFDEQQDDLNHFKEHCDKNNEYEAQEVIGATFPIKKETAYLFDM